MFDFHSNFTFNLSTVTLFLLIAWRTYWTITERQSNKEKHKLQKTSRTAYQKRLATLGIDVLVIVQLLGVQILSFKPSLTIQAIGFLAVIAGLAISVKARRDLGANWAHGAEYQIKAKHELVTRGIYNYIRHPIYLARLLMIVGAEVVAGSFLCLVFLLFLPPVAYIQAKKEEAILIREFGPAYTAYAQRTRMFLPFVW